MSALTDTLRKHNFCVVEYDVSLAQVRAIDGYLMQSVQLARLDLLNKEQFAVLLELQLKGMANGDTAMEGKLFRTLKYIMDNFHLKETQ